MSFNAKLKNIGLVLGVALIMVFALSASTSLAQNPFIIDGDIPDTADPAEIFDDPEGNVKELAAKNGSGTKIGPINTAILPMLDNTNPNPQVDLTEVRITSAVAADGDVWLYFFWERDSNNGSGFIALEVGDDPAPAECDFSGATSEQDLIDNCNPWENRADGDSLFLWDQQGNSLDIIQRIFDATTNTWGAGMVLNANEAEAEIGSDPSNGEMAVNLSDTIFDPGQCLSVANVLPSTVTGNSDSADYKDTVFFNFPGISNCGTVIIRKQTLPDGLSDTFQFDHNLVTEGAQDNPFFLADDGVETILNVFVNDPSDPTDFYFVTEADPSSAGFELVDIDCSASDTVVTPTEDEASRTVEFVLGVNETVDCTFTNQALASLTVQKNVVNACAVDSATFPIEVTDDEDTVIASASLGNGSSPLETGNIPPGTYDITEAGSGDYVTLVSCDNGGGLVEATTRAVTLNPGDDVTCTFRNVKKPSITVKKGLEWRCWTSIRPSDRRQHCRRQCGRWRHGFRDHLSTLRCSHQYLWRGRHFGIRACG